ncbi:MAG: hypothetical protein OXG35_00005, partial [Acidobacteria bacterium]|nr:hypothetical protein [Acidobacteriota bacterium]
MSPEPLTWPRIAAFWLPLAGTWLMMAAEGPYLAAIIARLDQPTENLAAFGVAFALAIIIEAPVIMLMAASTALVTDAASYAALRRFTYTLAAALTLVQVVAVLPSVFDWLALSLIGLPPDVARLAHHGLAIMLPWPIAIGYRRFRQGLLIRRRLTRLVTYGTALRLAAMSAAALAAARVPGLQGVHVGTIALATGVVVEAVASRVMTRGVVAELLAGPSPPAAADSGAAVPAAADTATADSAAAAAADASAAGSGPPSLTATDSSAAISRAAGAGPASPTAADSSAATSRAAGADHAGPADAHRAATDVRASRPVDALTMPAIFRFYLPLAMTSLLAMAVQPAVTFFVGQSRFALESLAVLPVIHGLTFLFRALGLSYQEVGIALFGDRWEQYRPIRNFGWMLAASAAGGLGVIVFTPLAVVWFEGVSGLPPELAAFALLPAQILALLPAGSVWICFQRAVLVHARQTAPITWAGILEVAVVVVLLTV